jgi:hypothetical protein
MKVEIYNSTPNPKPKPKSKEIVLRLALRNLGLGGVTLVAVDEDGYRVEAGTLLTLTYNGDIRRHIYVSDKIGLELDSQGRIVLEAE